MRSLAASVAALVIVALTNTSATAEGQCPEGTAPSSVVGGVCIPAAAPGDPGNGGSSSGGGAGSGGDSSNGDAGVDRCEWSIATPQPPASAPEWQGHSPDDGDLWMCVLPVRGNPVFQFRPNGEEAPPDPADLAKKALEELRLTVPDIHIAPAPPAKTYVGLETWLWMPPSQWSTLTKSVRAGATTVTVSAIPKRAVWDMGAGTTTCFDAGKPWDAGQMPRGASTTCKYVYDRVSDFQPNGRFNVAATISFDVGWRCAGNCAASEGALGEVEGLPGAAAISVGERQSVNTNGERADGTGVR